MQPPSWPGPAVARSENRRLVSRRSRPRSLSASKAKDADARSTAVGRQSSIPVSRVVLIPAGYGAIVPETLRHELELALLERCRVPGFAGRLSLAGGSEPGRRDGWQLMALAADGIKHRDQGCEAQWVSVPNVTSEDQIVCQPIPCPGSIAETM